MLINLLVWIIVGGIAGWLASAVVQGGGMGIVADVIVGIVGALMAVSCSHCCCQARLASAASTWAA